MINEPIARNIYSNPYLRGRNNMTRFHIHNGGWIPPNRNVEDLLELGWIPDDYINDETGRVEWSKVKEDADAVRLAKKVRRGEDILFSGLPEQAASPEPSIPYLDHN